MVCDKDKEVITYTTHFLSTFAVFNRLTVVPFQGPPGSKGNQGRPGYEGPRVSLVVIFLPSHINARLP